jgi:hypothetical protein
MKRQNIVLIAAGLLVGLALAAHLPLRAQGNGRPAVDLPQVDRPERDERAKPVEAHSIQDALLRPFHFNLPKPTALSEVASQLSRDLGGPVVLDLAALDRLDIKPDDKVQHELQGVRLKTGLKLLLDQVGLTYRVVPEDNLLVLTDKEGSEDPIERVTSELRDLHRDVHDLQDSLDELREVNGLQVGEGAKVRKPTIIEEVPDNADQKPKGEPAPKVSPRSDPGVKPPGTFSPRPRTGL